MDERDSSAVTRAVAAVARGEPHAAGELLPLVYDELRRIARARLAHMPPGQTLQPTALVHEAFLRVAGTQHPAWDGRAHFFAAAAQAMRHILIEQARRKASAKHGGGRKRADVDQLVSPIEAPADDMLALDEVLTRLEQEDARKHQLVMLRFFAGLSAEEAADVMGVSLRTVERDWRYTRAWLQAELSI